MIKIVLLAWALTISLSAQAAVKCNQWSSDGQACEGWSNGIRCADWSSDRQACEAWSNGTRCSQWSSDGQACETWSGSGPFGVLKTNLIASRSLVDATALKVRRNRYYRHDGYCISEEARAGMWTHEELIGFTYHLYCDY
jgi:hypothetical protein